MDELRIYLQNKKNLTSMVALLVMVAILPLGIYLAKLQQVFFSQASGEFIQVTEGNCVTEKNGDKALKCGTVPLVLYNPFRATPSPTPSASPSNSPTASPSNLPPGCLPKRPDIVRTWAMGPNGLTVNLTAATRDNLPSNPITQLQFHRVSNIGGNGTVTINNEVHSDPFTYDIPNGTNEISFLIKQVTYGQPTTVELKVTDSCGPGYPLFFGGGTGAPWPSPAGAASPTPTPTASPTPPPSVTPSASPNIGALNNGVISHWKFDETSGQAVADSKGINGATATGTSIIDGKLGKARQMNGGYVFASDNAAYNTGVFTVSAWVNPQSFGLNNYASIYSRRTSGNIGVYLELLGDPGTGNGELQCHIDRTTSFDNGLRVRTTAKLTANQWNLATCSYDGNTLKVYINGSMVGSSSGSGTLVNTSGMTTIIGKNPTGLQVLNGSIDDVIVWNRALSDAEVTALYNGGQGVLLAASSENRLVHVSKVVSSKLADLLNSFKHFYHNFGLKTADAQVTGVYSPFRVTPFCKSATTIVNRVEHRFSTTASDIGINREPAITNYGNFVTVGWARDSWSEPFEDKDVTFNRTYTYTLYLDGQEYGPVTVTTPASCPDNVPPAGKIDSVSCTSIVGFACDKSDMSTPTQLHLYADGVYGNGGRFITTGVADKPFSSTNIMTQLNAQRFCSNDPNTPFGAVGNVSFEIPVPDSLKDGRPHSIYVHAMNKPAGFNPPIEGPDLLKVTINGTDTKILNNVITCAPPATPPPSFTPTVPPTQAPTEEPSPTVAPEQCTDGPLLGAELEEQNCGTLTTTMVTGATSGTLKYKAPNLQHSEALCTVMVATNNLGGCSLNSNGKGTIENPLLPGEEIDIQFTNACQAPPADDLTSGSVATAFGGCKLSLAVSPEIDDDQEEATESANLYTYKIAETENGLADATEKEFDGNTENFNATYVLKNQQPGLKQFWVEFKEHATGDVVRDTSSNIELLAPDPELLGVNCSSALGSGKLIVDINGTNFGPNNGQAEVKVSGTVASKDQWDSGYIKASLNPSTPVQDGSEFAIDIKVADGRRFPTQQCKVGFSNISLGTKLFCRGDGSFAVKGAKVMLIDEYGTKVEEIIDIDHDGTIRGLQTKLSDGKNYVLSIKSPRVLRRNVTFKALAGTTVLSKSNGEQIVLPIGDIAPRPDGDGSINTLDRSLLLSQWRLTAATQPLTGDFNVDNRVNSFDWACMRYDFNKSDDKIPDFAPKSVFTGGIPVLPLDSSPSPTSVSSPSVVPSQSPSPSGGN